MKHRSPVLAVSVLGFCAWQSRDLWDAWRHAPFDRLDPLVFAIWVSPALFAFCLGRVSGAANAILLLIAAAASLLGAISDLNVLQQLALAAALASFVPANAFVMPWLLASVSWMPVFGWCGSGWGLPAVIAARLLLALAAAVWGCRLLSTPRMISTV
jgi:hypothetical protein